MSRRGELQEILDNGWLCPQYQRMVDLQDGSTSGFLSFISGTASAGLHSPKLLRRAAAQAGSLLALDSRSLVTVINDWLQQNPVGLLFVTISAEALLGGVLADRPVKQLFARQGGLRNRIVLEVCDGMQHDDLTVLIATLQTLHEKNYRFALHDIGESRAALRLWAETRPDFLVLGQHFVNQIDVNGLNQQFVRAIKQLAEQTQTRLIADGIQSAEEWVTLRQIGVSVGRGDKFGQPSSQMAALIRQDEIGVVPAGLQPNGFSRFYLAHGKKASSLLSHVPTVSVETLSEEALQILLDNPALNVLPVLDGRRPAGLIKRSMVDKFSSGYVRDIYSKKPCIKFMDPSPLIVEMDIPLISVSQMVLKQGQARFNDGFVIVQNGEYQGVGSNFELMQEMTRQQIEEARYANPLTLLPGNVPINEQMQALLDHGIIFHAAYVDIDHFKPFNDVFGYRRGDDIIKMTARVLLDETDANLDFVGHIGGDDFFVLLQSEQWESQCRSILTAFDNAICKFVHEEQLGGDAYVAEDRRGNRTTYPFPSLSIGVVPVSGQFHDIHEISTVAAEVKKAAKNIPGSSLYVDQRAKPASTL